MVSQKNMWWKGCDVIALTGRVWHGKGARITSYQWLISLTEIHVNNKSTDKSNLWRLSQVMIWWVKLLLLLVHLLVLRSGIVTAVLWSESCALSSSKVDVSCDVDLSSFEEIISPTWQNAPAGSGFPCYNCFIRLIVSGNVEAYRFRFRSVSIGLRVSCRYFIIFAW